MLRIYDAFNSGDARTVTRLFDPEIEIEYRGPLPDLQGTYHGWSGARQFTTRAVENFEDFHFEVEECADVGGRVVAVLHERAAGLHSGAPADIRVADVWEIRAGRAVRWGVYSTRDEALREAMREGG